MNKNQNKAIKLLAKTDYMQSINDEICTIKQDIFDMLDNKYSYDEKMSVAAAFLKNIINQGCLINTVSLRNQLMDALKKINYNEYKKQYESEQGKLFNHYRSNAAHNFEYQPNIEIQYDSSYIMDVKESLQESLQKELLCDNITQMNLYQNHFYDINNAYMSQYNMQTSYLNQNYYVQQPMINNYTQPVFSQQYNYYQQIEV